MTPNILVAIPAYGNMVSVSTLNATHSLIQMFASMGIRGGIAAFSFPDVAEARNILLTGWYDGCPEATHLLFVDSDMGFGPEVVRDMLIFGEPLVGAIYRKKTESIEWAASGLGGERSECRGNYMKVAGLGMGCFLIKREAITEMLEKMPELSDDRMEFHAAKHMLGSRIIRAFDSFDDPDDKTHGRLSEDLAFCARWRMCGGDVWASIGYEIEHVGSYSYKASYAKFVAEKGGELQKPLSLVDAAKQMAAE